MSKLQIDQKNMLKRASTSNVASNDENQDTRSKKQKTDEVFKRPDTIIESRSNGSSLASKVKDVEIVKAESSDTPAVASSLPEGFFDDPDLDAKVRGVDRAKNLDQEYEEFKKLMQTEEQISDNIVEKDDTNRDFERDLAEVDELIVRWSKVEDLHKKREALLELQKKKAEGAEWLNVEHSENGSSSKSNGSSHNRKAQEESDSDEEVDLSNVLSLDIRDKKRC
jgi:zinc finger protein 830